MKIVVDIYEVCKQLPDSEKYNLISPLKRSSVSIPSNIAEGCSRSTDKEFKRFLEIAQGSAFGLETQLLLVVQLGLIDSQKLAFEQINILKASINSLINKLNKANGK